MQPYKVVLLSGLSRVERNSQSACIETQIKFDHVTRQHRSDGSLCPHSTAYLVSTALLNDSAETLNYRDYGQAVRFRILGVRE
jgi:hypothetical protein